MAADAALPHGIGDARSTAGAGLAQSGDRELVPSDPERP